MLSPKPLVMVVITTINNHYPVDWLGQHIVLILAFNLNQTFNEEDVNSHDLS